MPVTLTPVAPTENKSSTTYRFDPINPVPSCGGNVSSLSEVKPLGRGITDPAYASFEGRIAASRSVKTVAGLSPITPFFTTPPTHRVSSCRFEMHD